MLDTVRWDAGTEKVVSELACRLDRSRFEPQVCCFESSERLEQLSACLETKIFPLTRIHSLEGVRQLLRFRRYLKRGEIEIVHAFMNKAGIFSVLAGMGRGGPAVITSRLNSGYWHTKRLVALFRLLNRFTTHILANSRYVMRAAATAEQIRADKISVIYPGVDVARYSSGVAARTDAIGIPSEAPVVGIVANLRPVKDLALFLEAARYVQRAVPQAAFLIVGQGELRAPLEELANRLGIGSSVFFADGRVEVPDCLARMSVACLSSRSEGLPNAILEYMAAGLPVVATDVGGVAELVEHGVTGLLVFDRSPEQFAEPVIRLLQDAPLRARLGSAGSARAENEFRLPAAVARLEEFYDRVLAGARTAGSECGAS